MSATPRRRPASRRSPSRRRGNSLPELLAAGALIAVSLAGTMRLLTDAMDVGLDLERRDVVVTLAVSKTEEHLARAAVDFEVGTFEGTFASEDEPQVRYRVERSTDLAAGGVPDRLLALRVVVWDDRNGDAAPSPAEPIVVFASKVAKLSAFQG